MSAYDFTVQNKKKEDFKLDGLKGKVTLVVNVASKCGFTPQYAGLEELYKKFADKGLEIIGFPCNQFGAQEPGSNEEIESFCQLNYGVSFQIMDKIDVNGDKASDFYKFLKSERPGLLGSEMIKWNFTKFLIDQNGNVIQRFAPKDKPESIEVHIKKLLES